MNKNDFNKIKDMFSTFAKCQTYKLANLALSHVKVSELSQDAMIAYLEATLEDKDKLEDRQKFVESCKTVLQQRNEKVKQLFEYCI